MADYIFYGWFTATKQGKAGLTVTCTVYGPGGTEASAQAATEIGGGLYKYTHADTVAGDYSAVFATSDATVDMQHVPALALQQIVVYLDAAISSRSSHSAADVWAVASRTLTSFGTLVADIWTYVTRELTGFGTLVSQIITALSGAAITLVAPVLSSERVEIVAGDDYKNADGRALIWTLSGFPVFTGGSVLLSAGPLQVAGTVVSATQLRVELTAAQSALLTPGTRVEFKLKVTLSGGNKITAARGYIEVA